MQQLIFFRTALRDRWLLVMLVFLLVTAGATVGVYLNKPVFESRAAVFVNVERLGVSVSRADVRQDIAVLQAVEAVTSQAEVLRSRDLIERAVDSLDPAIFKSKPPRNRFLAMIVSAVADVREFFTEVLRDLRLLPPANERYELVKQITDNLSVSTVRQAQVIRLGFSAQSAETARVVLLRLLDLYVERAATNTVEIEGAGMLVRQAGTVRVELEETERELFALRARYDIADLGAEKVAIIERINRLTTVVEGATDAPPSVTAGAAPAAPARRSVIEVPASDAINSAVGGQVVELRAQLNTMLVNRVGLAADLAGEHPRLRSLDQQIASTEALLRQGISALKNTISSNRERLHTLTSVEPQLQRLQRTAAMLSESYDVYRKAAEDRRLMREQEARLQIQIVDPPSVPYAPSGPVPALLVAAGALLGLLAGVGLALLLSFLDGPSRREQPPAPTEPVAADAATASPAAEARTAGV